MTHKNDEEIHFRKKALEYASRPVPLDDALRVISLRSWIALIVLLLIILIFIIWLITGSIFIRVSGKGVLISLTGNIVGVQSPLQAGLIKTIHVQPGQAVKKNEVLISFNNDLLSQLRLKKIYLDQLKTQQKKLVTQANEVITAIQQLQSQQTEKSQKSLAVAQEKLQQLQILVGFTLRDQWRERERTLALQIYKEEYEYGLLKKRWEESYAVLSPMDGMVSEIRAKEGDYVTPGKVLLNVIPANQQLYALVFVPATKGKLLKKGMTAQIQPTFVNKLEYGAIEGKITDYSLFPITQENIFSTVKNKELLTFFGATQPMISVKITLKKNKSTVSGYEWTTSSGPELKLTQGSLVEATINIERKRPIELLIGGIKNAIN